jgi:plastocyanin
MLLLGALLAAIACATQAWAGTAAPPKPKLAKVLDDYYSPPSIGLPRGGSLKWIWPARNLHPHNVRLVNGPRGVSKKAYRSPTRVRRFSFERAFPKPGGYEFVCTLHPFTMRQSVKVRR